MTKHKHHIIPKHAGGTNDKSNLIELTIPEHAEAHRKLFEEHGRWQDRVAWQTLAGMITCAEAIKHAQRLGSLGIPKSKETKDKISKTLTGRKLGPHSKEHKEKIGKGNRNKIISKETRQKISNSIKGTTRTFTEEHCKNLSKSRMGKKHSESTRQNMSKNHADVSGENNPNFGRKGKDNPCFGMKHKTILCPHCLRNIPINVVKRWHLDKCKLA